MTKFNSFYFGEYSLQLIYIYMDDLGGEERDRYIEVIDNFKWSKDWNYLDFDIEAEGGIENYYIDGGIGAVGIKEIIAEIQELTEYLNKNKIEWSGSRQGVDFESDGNGIVPGIICITKKEIIFVSCNNEGEVEKETYGINKIKL